jgi:hypothetical protein
MSFLYQNLGIGHVYEYRTYVTYVLASVSNIATFVVYKMLKWMDGK